MAKDRRVIDDSMLFNAHDVGKKIIYWGDIPPRKLSYTINIINVNSPRYKKMSGQTAYVCFDIYLIEGFNRINYDLSKIHEFHVPLLSLKRAWANAKQSVPPEDKFRRYVVELEFIKKDRSLIIIKRNFVEEVYK